MVSTGLSTMNVSSTTGTKVYVPEKLLSQSWTLIDCRRLASAVTRQWNALLADAHLQEDECSDHVQFREIFTLLAALLLCKMPEIQSEWNFRIES